MSKKEDQKSGLRDCKKAFFSIADAMVCFQKVFDRKSLTKVCQELYIGPYESEGFVLKTLYFNDEFSKSKTFHKMNQTKIFFYIGTFIFYYGFKEWVTRDQTNLRYCIFV